MDLPQSAKDAGYVSQGLMAYQGKEGCRDDLCTRRLVRDPDGRVNWDESPCVGWHCADCDEPSSYQGHGGRCVKEGL